MSLKTWKEEFYPIPSDEVSESQALAHSLRKWEGLRKENLEKHGVGSSASGVMEFFIDFLPIDSSTCALCHYHVDSVRCVTCPLVKLTRGGNCDSAYVLWSHAGDPEPMIELIKLAANKENKS